MSLQPVELGIVKQERDVVSLCGKSEATGGRMTQNRVRIKEEIEDKNLIINTFRSTSGPPASLINHAEHTDIRDDTRSKNKSSPNETYKCDMCDEWFTLKSKLMEHFGLHRSMEQESKLGSADKGTSSSHTSRRLRSEHEPSPTDQRYSCAICNKAFRFIGNLKVHERIHTGEKPFSCEVCKQKFTQIGNLKAHKLIHTGEKPYTCGVCKQRFTGSPNLKKHERIHLAEKPYSCGICQQKFSLLSYLKKHERIHIEKIYSCGVCKEKFANNVHLKTHKRLNMECWRV